MHPLLSIASLHPCQYRHEEDLVTEICQSLKRAGGCIIRNMVSRAVLDALESDIRPFLNNTGPAHGTKQNTKKRHADHLQRVEKNLSHPQHAW